MHIEFITRIGKPFPYTGKYQFQYMTDEEIDFYVPILKKVFDNYDKLAQIWFKRKPLRE